MWESMIQIEEHLWDIKTTHQPDLLLQQDFLENKKMRLNWIKL